MGVKLLKPHKSCYFKKREQVSNANLRLTLIAEKKRTTQTQKNHVKSSQHQQRHLKKRKGKEEPTPHFTS